MAVYIAYELIKERCRTNGFGFPKRLDEHRELVELLVNDTSTESLLKKKPWVLTWLQTQDEFLEFLMSNTFSTQEISQFTNRSQLRSKPNYSLGT